MASTLSTTQYNIAVTLSVTSSCLSIMGSACIAFIAWRRLNQFFHRLVFGISIADIVLSTACLLQPFLIPPVDPLYDPLAIGNTTTCSVLGFMMRFPLAVATYNCYLSLYFNYSVRNGWNESMHVALEIAMHCVAFGAAMLFGIIGTVTESFNPLPLVHICDTGPWPPSCDTINDMECIRGESYLLLDWTYLGLLLLPSAIGMWNTASVYMFVKRQSEKSARRSSSLHLRLPRQQPDFHTQHSTVRQVANQAMLYMLAYLNGFLWAMTSRILFDKADIEGRDSEPQFYLFLLLAYFFFPLQGFWNSYIYIRPRFRVWRRLHPEKSWSWIAKRILQAEEPILQRRRSTRMRSTASRRLTVDRGGDISELLQRSLDSFSLSFFRDTTGKSGTNSNESLSANGMTRSGGATSGYISPPKSMEASSSNPSALDEEKEYRSRASSSNEPSFSDERQNGGPSQPHEAIRDEENHDFEPQSSVEFEVPLTGRIAGDDASAVSTVVDLSGDEEERSQTSLTNVISEGPSSQQQSSFTENEEGSSFVGSFSRLIRLGKSTSEGGLSDADDCSDVVYDA